MPQVGVDLVAKGNIASEANKAADAMAALAAQEHKVQAIARSLGTKDVKLVGKALEQVAQAEAKAIAKNSAAEKKAHTREVKYAKQDLRGLGVSLEMQDKILQKIGPEMAGALATGVELAAGLAAGIAVAAVAAGALGVAISSAAFEAGGARDSAKAMIGILTGGQGEKALALIDKQSQALGISLQQGREDFIKFRQAGLDNTQSAKLEQLRADLLAAKVPADQVAKALDQVMDLKGGSGTEEKMKELAKQAGVLGNGAKAAAVANSTLGGALARLDNTKTLALEQIFDRISPSIDKAATAVANMLQAFMGSAKGQKMIDGLGKAIVWVVDTAVSSLPLIGQALEGVISAGEWVVNAYNAVANVFATNSTAAAALSYVVTGLKVVGYALAAALAVVVAGAVLLAAPLYAAVAAVLAVTGAVASAIAYIYNLGAEMTKAGSAIIDGLIAGIMSKIANVKAVIGNLASSISGGFKSALGINSPSKVFAQFGEHTAAGYEQGVDKHMPTGEDFAANVAPGGSAAPVASAGAAAAGAGGGGGGPLINIENLVVPVGVEPEPFARAVRRELTLLLQVMQISKGVTV